MEFKSFFPGAFANQSISSMGTSGILSAEVVAQIDTVTAEISHDRHNLLRHMVAARVLYFARWRHPDTLAAFIADMLENARKGAADFDACMRRWSMEKSQ